MKPATQSQRFVSRIEALADPTRLRLLRLLERQELGVAELCDVLQLPQSTVSRHLKLLSEQGYIGSRRHATSNLYRMEALDGGGAQLWDVAREETGRWPTAQQDDRRLAQHLELKRSKSLTFFAGAAESWDGLRSQLYGDHFNLSALLGLLPRDWTVADLGCGAGHLATVLAPHVRKVIGIDESAAMLAAAARRTVSFENIELREGQLERVPLRSAICDAALLVLTLSYVADVSAVIQELARVLRPSGRAVIVDLLPHEREDFRREMGQQCLGFAPEEIETLLGKAGLKQIHVYPLPPEPEAKGPALFLATAERPAASH